MNYRHAFHAGNHADVLKHVTLLWILGRMRRKRAPFAVLDTHAGPGLYDLAGADARRSPEWETGAARVWDWEDAPWSLQPYRRVLSVFNATPPGAEAPLPRRLDLTASSGLLGAILDAPPLGAWPDCAAPALRVYPGSPALIAAALRRGDPKTPDRLIACERHPEDSQSLKRLFRDDRSAQIHARDGWEGLHALLPFPERRGIALIDPPYEEEGELARAAREIGRALARAPGVVFIWWRPLKDGAAVDAADAELRQHARALAAPPEILRADLAVAAASTTGKLTASSVVIVNPPYADIYGLGATLADALPALAVRLATGPGGFWRVV